MAERVYNNQNVKTPWKSGIIVTKKEMFVLLIKQTFLSNDENEKKKKMNKKAIFTEYNHRTQQQIVFEYRAAYNTLYLTRSFFLSSFASLSNCVFLHIFLYIFELPICMGVTKSMK